MATNYYDRAFHQITQSELHLRDYFASHPSAEGWETWLQANMPDLWHAVEKAQDRVNAAYRKKPVRTYAQYVRAWGRLALEGMKVFKNMHVLLEEQDWTETTFLQDPDLHVVELDVETQKSLSEVGGYDNIRALKVSFATVFDCKTWEVCVYDPSTVRQLVDHVVSADIVIGYNHAKFDMEVLRGECASAPLDRPKLFDIMIDLQSVFQWRLRLENVLGATLGTAKGGDGLQAIEWWRSKEWAKLIRYNVMDVKEMHELWCFGASNGFIHAKNKGGNVVTVPTPNWASLEMRTKAIGQMRMFDNLVESPMSKKGKLRVHADHDFAEDGSNQRGLFE